MRVLICRLVVMATPLAGCASVFDQSQDFLVPPGKYQFLRCQDLAQQSLANAARERELTSLMERADQSAAGPVVNATVYWPELHQVQANVRQLRQATNEKNCNAGGTAPTTTPAPPPAPATPAR